MCDFVCRRHNSTLTKLHIYQDIFSIFYSFSVCISFHVGKFVQLELVLCLLRNVHVTQIDASLKRFDDADATRIAEALRCEHPVHV